MYAFQVFGRSGPVTGPNCLRRGDPLHDSGNAWERIGPLAHSPSLPLELLRSH